MINIITERGQGAERRTGTARAARPPLFSGPARLIASNLTPSFFDFHRAGGYARSKLVIVDLVISGRTCFNSLAH
jgi:hypothetical protein